MEIEERLTEGCDRLSRVYGNMFNVLQEIMQDKEKLKELSPLDYSAIGLYIGKFVEQEINSSVVQLMRQFCGIDMPDYYCKVCREYGIDADVRDRNKNIRLNEQNGLNNTSELKTIPLGDAFHALERLKEEDSDDFFNDYPWLNDNVFLEAWRRLFRFRNRVAHIGELIDLETLEENFVFFQRFIKFMPDILELKKELAPDDYIDSLPTVKHDDIDEKQVVVTSDNNIKPHASKEVAQRYLKLSESEELTEEYYDLFAKYNFDAVVFEGSDGKLGLKDCLGNILVPTRYDGFGFIPKPLEFSRKSVNVYRDGKYYLVSMDGSGRELTESYDYIGLAIHAHMYSPYIYQKDGCKSYGFMDMLGNEICDCYVDKYGWGLDSIWYVSGDKQGYWQFGNIFLPPIYDNIEMLGEPWDPLIFTLDGVQGLVKHDGSFFPLSEYKKLDEDEQNDTAWDYLCEQYEVG